jgi:hypothetical protein
LFRLSCDFAEGATGQHINGHPPLTVVHNWLIDPPLKVNISSGKLFGNKQLCPNFAAWQGAGQDAGSKGVAGLPTATEVVAMGKVVLGIT